MRGSAAVPSELFDDAEFERFTRGIRKLWNIDLSSYGQRQLHRRLRGMMSRGHAETLDEFLVYLSNNPAESELLKDRFTINVSEFFRDAHLFAKLEKMLGPGGECAGARKVWSAGCSYGAEPYTLAMILSDTGRGSDCQLYATDIDQGVLERARAGIFTERDIRNVSEQRRQRYFKANDDGTLTISSQLRPRVLFAKLDLLAPGGKQPMNCDLILCRNVIIYFTDEAKAGVQQMLVRSLRPGGVLLIGATERVPDASDLGLQSMGPFFYKKVA
jgi:chemotaxis protein methyltransferase CheR